MPPNHGVHHLSVVPGDGRVIYLVKRELQPMQFHSIDVRMTHTLRWAALSDD